METNQETDYNLEITNDPYWIAASKAMMQILICDDVVLAPAGAWPELPGSLQFYTGCITLAGASALILHKGQLPAIRKADLSDVWQNWQCVYANEVFVCFATGRRLRIDKRQTQQRKFTRRLHNYLHSSQLKRRPGTLFMLHLPKTAGTSVWNALSSQVTSKIYYESIDAFLYNPPRPGEFDLVGGHIPLHLILPRLQSGDHVVGLVRCPTARFRSAFLHGRRQDIDPKP